MERGDKYEKVAKVISVAILFYKAGTDGTDCIYGANEFTDLRTGEKIDLTEKQQKHYNVKSFAEVFPEYYLLVVENFNNVAKSNLDEWLYFLKNEKIEDSFTAPGLREAKEILDSSKLDDAAYRAYERYQDDRRRTVGEIDAAIADGMDKGERKKALEIARELLHKGIDVKTIADCTGLNEEEVESLREQ
jgi:predicted transposase/invertase (TIGR01784 family)